MYTVDMLLDLACTHENTIHAPVEANLQGRSIWAVYSEMMTAFNAALYLDINGIAATTSIGPFHEAIAPGKVKVLKGASVRSNSRRLTRNAGRDYVVKVLSVVPGSVFEDQHKLVVRTSTVVWLSDGYQCVTDIGNVIQVAA